MNISRPSIAVIFVSFLFCGCTHRPLEIFHVDYQMAPHVQPPATPAVSTVNPNDRIGVQHSSSTACAHASQDVMRLDQVALVVESEGVGFDGVKNCSTLFPIAVGESRDAGLRNKFILRPGQVNGEYLIDLTANGPDNGRTDVPTGIVLQTTQPLGVGGRTSGGFAEITFGTQGPVFRCESGALDDPWDQHITDPLQNTFLLTQLTSVDTANKTAAIEFKCLARNKNDPADHRLMVIVDGIIAMLID